MTPDESLAYLYGLQQFGIKLGLENIRGLLRRLGDPQADLRCLHVAGTNGKGSVSAFLAEMLRHAGYRVGLYTSPHLHEFTERIRIDGEPLGLDQLPPLVEKVKAAGAGIPATFFEATTALALLAFRQAGVEVVVLETGMGGRLDATNAVEPAACLITPVALDHQEHLGATLAAIAAEKAGIIKTGVPVVSGVQAPEAAAVIVATAAERQAELWQAGNDYQWGGDHAAMWFRGPGLSLDGLRCALAGDHQLANYAQSLAGAACLRRSHFVLPDVALRRAGETVRWPGRLEWWGEPPAILLDGAHNAAGAAMLARYLEQRVGRPVRLVVGLSGRRRPDEVLDPLAGLIGKIYAAPVPEVATVAPEELVDWARRHHLDAAAFATPEVALTTALADRNPAEPVVVAGSLYLVAAVRSLLCADAAWSLSVEREDR
ncbi:MAG: bifunctional folylpolyglutamate synthase/dihydrofolate synthase [Desulfuromonadales bacterium]|nr:bifunctional folylpolyglutamate synthase/dihydrofolate synthase [Desulfuromonadales bacterium]